MALTTGIIFGLLVMFLWGISKVIIRPAISRIGPFYSLFYEQFFVILSLAMPLLFYVKPYVPPQGIMLRIAVAVVVGTIPIYFFFRAMDIGKMSLVTPIANSSSIITILLSYLFYKEILTSKQVFAVVLLITGVILISFRYSEIRKLRFSRKLISGAEFALITMVGWGFYFSLIKPIVVELGPMLSVLYLEGGIFTILLAIFIISCIKNGAVVKPGRSLPYVFFGGFTTALGALFFNMAIRNSAVSLIYPLANSSLLVTVIASYIFLKERIEFNQKIAIFLVSIGIILVSV